jgi:hypothetical protein
LTDCADQRRQPRLLSTCRVEIRDRFTSWSCETANVGPRGCLLVTPRWLTVGSLLKLRITSERLEQPLEVAGQVVWTQKDIPFRAGVSFTGATAGTSPAKWFDGLTGAIIEEILRTGERAAAFGDSKIYLGSPPAFGPLEPDELEVVRVVAGGAPLSDVLDRDPAAVRSLLTRGRLTLARAEAVAPARWANALSREPARIAAGVAGSRLEGRELPELVVEVGDPDGPSPELSRLLECAVDAILDGDVPAAERFLRDARDIAPEDATAELLLTRIGLRRSGRVRRGFLELATSADDAEAS